MSPDCADLGKALLNTLEPSPLASKSEPTIPTIGADLEFAVLKAPGGFRRAFLQGEHKPLLEVLRPLIRVGYFESVFGQRLNDDGEEIPLPPGESGIPQTILALAKSFVGSGITFLPGAFVQGGWLFSSIVIVVIGFCNAVCISLLLDCSSRTGKTGFGEIAQDAAGAPARNAVHVSLVISQFGTNVAYMIFICQMAESLGVLAWVSNVQLTLLVLAAIIPLSCIRSLHRMEFAILAADALIVFGLGVVVWYTATDLIDTGLSTSIQPFSASTCGLFMGTAVFTFEGIPFILPIKNSMREPHLFWPLFKKVFTCIVVFFAAFGYVGYVAYGSGTDAVVLLNLPNGQPVVMLVRLAYMVALILGSPMVFLPAARITEFWVFGEVKEKGSKKCQKNAMRALEMCCLGVAAVYGGRYFETFLAFVGALCCAPIAFIYPAFFHLRLCAQSPLAKGIDCFFIALGAAAMVFVTYETVASFKP